MPSRYVGAIEIAIRNRQCETLASARLAGLRVHVVAAHACEAAFRRARRRAAIAIDLIAVVAGLSGIDVAVSAWCLAHDRCAVHVATTRLHGASFGTARPVAIEEAIESALVARLPRFLHSIAADRLNAFPRASVAGKAGLGETRARAPVTPDGVAVIASLASRNLEIAAERNAVLACDPALPSGLDDLAIAATAVAARHVAVIASLVAREATVSADRRRDAGGAHVRTSEVGFYATDRVASVAPGLVLVVAFLARIELSITTVS